MTAVGGDPKAPPPTHLDGGLAHEAAGLIAPHRMARLRQLARHPPAAVAAAGAFVDRLDLDHQGLLGVLSTPCSLRLCSS